MPETPTTSNDLLISAWSEFARRSPRGIVRHYSGAAAAFSGDPLSFFNGVFLTQAVPTAAALEESLAEAITFARVQAVPYFVAACEEYLPAGAAPVFEQLGLALTTHWTGMAAAALAPPARPFPGEFSCHEVVEPSQRVVLSDINCLCYDAPLPWGHATFTRETFWEPGLVASLGSLLWKPVSTAAVLALGETLYLVMVATRPEYRRRGFAEATLRHVIGTAGSAIGGWRHLALHATCAGLPLYTQIGFRAVARFAVYSPAR